MTSAAELEFFSLLSCPQCQVGLVKAGPAATCPQCGTVYAQVNGIWRMLTAAQQDRYRKFLANYRPVRQAEGWERPDRDYYLNLPQVPPDDPQAGIWRIRQRSFNRVKQIVGENPKGWALDLGAGNGWLSRHLVKLGYRVASLDLNADGPDSLEGAQLYLEHDKTWFGRVQASMDRLPFLAGSFDLCIASGSVHYAALEKTVGEVRRVLTKDGRFIVTDSPVYRQREAGRVMIEEFKAQVRGGPNQEIAWPGGDGFLVESDLQALLTRLGFTIEFYPVERRLGRFKRKVMKFFRPPKREEASFPVILARKTTVG